MEWLSTKIDNALRWFADAIKAMFSALWDMVSDIFIALVELVLDAIAALIALIPMPAFMSNGGLGALFSGVPSSVQYLFIATGLIDGLAIIAAGVAFLLLRKILTLGQW